MSNIVETDWTQIDVNSVNKLNKNDLISCFNFIIKELQNNELEQYEIDEISSLLNINNSKISTVKKYNDLLKFIDISSICEKNPELAKRLISKLLLSLGKAFPCFSFAGAIVSKLPQNVFNFLIQVGAVVDPIHMIRKGVNQKYISELEKASLEQEALNNLGADITKLIIVTKNISIGKELENLIVTNDDENENEIIGTRDNTVQPIIMNSQAWDKVFAKIPKEYKILILCEANHISKLTTNHIIFNKFGVRYGWKNNIAQIEVDYTKLNNKKDYEKFYNELIQLEVSEKFKKKSIFNFNFKSIVEIALGVPFLIGTDIIKANNDIKQQQLIYGLYNLYINDLQKFIDE